LLNEHERPVTLGRECRYGEIVTFHFREGKKVAAPEVVKQRILDIEKSAFIK